MESQGAESRRKLEGGAESSCRGERERTGSLAPVLPALVFLLALVCTAQEEKDEVEHIPCLVWNQGHTTLAHINIKSQEAATGTHHGHRTEGNAQRIAPSSVTLQWGLTRGLEINIISSVILDIVLLAWTLDTLGDCGDGL